MCVKKLALTVNSVRSTRTDARDRQEALILNYAPLQ